MECGAQPIPRPELRRIVLRIQIRYARGGARRPRTPELVHRRFCSLGGAICDSFCGMDAAAQETGDSARKRRSSSFVTGETSLLRVLTLDRKSAHFRLAQSPVYSTPPAGYL